MSPKWWEKPFHCNWQSAIEAWRVQSFASKKTFWGKHWPIPCLCSSTRTREWAAGKIGKKEKHQGEFGMACEELHGNTVSTGVISAFGCVFDRDFFHKGMAEYLSIPCCFLSLACWWDIMVCCTRLFAGWCWLHDEKSGICFSKKKRVW